MRRGIIDTNLYIDWLNAGRPEGVLFQRDAVKYLSAVVVLEALRGSILASRSADRARRGGGVRADRPHPDPDGRGLRGRGTRAASASGIARVPGGGLPSLVNDVLIALSARSIGATVVTGNARDFAAIREVRPFKLTVVPA